MQILKKIPSSSPSSWSSSYACMDLFSLFFPCIFIRQFFLKKAMRVLSLSPFYPIIVILLYELKPTMNCECLREKEAPEMSFRRWENFSSSSVSSPSPCVVVLVVLDLHTSVIRIRITCSKNKNDDYLFNPVTNSYLPQSRTCLIIIIIINSQCLQMCKCLYIYIMSSYELYLKKRAKIL